MSLMDVGQCGSRAQRAEIHIDTDIAGRWAPGGGGGGARRSQVALTAYPPLMEAYRLNEEAAKM